MAVKMHLRMQKMAFLPVIESFSTLMNGLCKKGSLEEANNIFKLMLVKGLVPNVHIYSKMIISNCKRGCIKGALKMHYEM